MKHAKWISLFIHVSIVVICFMPWTYHQDVQMYFNGFESAKNQAGKNVYGEPGKFIIICTLLGTIMNFIPKVWAKFAQLFFTGIVLAYAMRCYHLYTSSYMGYTPQKQAGMYLIVAFSIASFVLSMLPDLKIKK
jgi:hypothetical protein